MRNSRALASVAGLATTATIAQTLPALDKLHSAACKARAEVGKKRLTVSAPIAKILLLLVKYRACTLPFQESCNCVARGSRRAYVSGETET